MLRRILGMARGAAARGGPAARPGMRPGPRPTHRSRGMGPGAMGPRRTPGPRGGNADIERGVRSIVRGVTRRRRGL